VSGFVVNAGTTRPVSYALVELRPAKGSAGPADRMFRVLTDVAGRWSFRTVPAGSATIHASAYGYVPAAFGQRLPGGPSSAIEIEEGGTTAAIQIQLWQHAVITGTIRDEYGEPLVGTTVRVFRRDAPGPRVRHIEAGSATTNDLGQYRVVGLLPAEYVLAAATSTIHNTSAGAAELYERQLKGNPGETNLAQARLNSSGIFNPMAPSMRVGEGRVLSATLSSFDLMPPAPVAGERPRVLQRTYYPAASGASTAEGITLRSGETRSGIDVTVRAVPAAQIRGVVIGPDGPEALIGVQLLHAPEDAYGSATASIGEFPLTASPTDGSGRFHFAGVSAGRYRLHVLRMPRTTMPQAAIAEGSLWASEVIHVGTADMDNLTITLSRGWRVSGVVVGGGGARTPGLEKAAITLSLADGRPFPGHLPGKCDGQGAFQTIEYPSGRYYIDVTGLPPGWSVQSVVAAGRDIQTGSVELRDRDLTDLVITVTDKPAGVAGFARTATGAADEQATVAIFPLDYPGWLQQGGHPRFAREARVDRAGAFRVTEVPPGQYLIASIDDADGLVWRTAPVLSTMAKRATRVTVEAGRDTSVTLTTGRR
jgi:hypothetical protein